MNKIFHIQSSFKAVQGEESIEEVVIEGLASTDHVDRVGDVIELSAWKGGLTNFKTNPVILFNHNADKPIGKALSVRVTERGLELRAKISKIAGDVATLIQEGILGAFSVGFKIKDAEWDDEINGLRIKS
ncbi:MAG TPA: HK97 family phage prohead protease, partial [Thermodesulfobacteriota bacterium]|nr:HK97 family phage prohead protease [Thermodesulfobacteriota bacterium]